MNGVNGRRNNPYIIGIPIRERSQFYGRESLFCFIEDQLLGDVKVILLHGQRRIGKSSVLQQIPNFIKSNEFIFVQFDLEHQRRSSLSSIIHDLATAIIEQVTKQLKLDDKKLQRLTKAELEQDINLFTKKFLPHLYKTIKYKKIVLLLDEFDVINNSDKNNNIVEQENFILFLEKLINEQPNLFVIPVSGTHLHDLHNLPTLFRCAPNQEIDVLDDISAENIIVNPAKDSLIYQPEAIKKILQLSARHPCFIQVICFTLFEKARNENKSNIEAADVKNILNQAIKKADSFLQSFWDTLTIEEKIIITTVAEAEKRAIEQQKKVPEEPLYLLDINNTKQREQLRQAWEKLRVKGYLYQEGRKIKVELIRHWLLQYHSFTHYERKYKILK
ncbi:ATP-binding protein [Nostoc sp. CENA67]|uniref:ATP-binding protein n=1 Tax=Amazonocrinis nigriterrae CENA67 TaxID=2794033 RepID=A0A8J7HKU1_9NOST|nr:ATP-binding protein [Amazonocrinis nigriterrae]MBH8561416.1 ATP-binding protein [Amazonocrinis nigriterrae CENA67]